jgi:hypothetical protein
MGGLLRALLLVGLIAKFWWLILLVLAAVAVGCGIWCVVTHLDAEDDRRHRERLAIAGRADEQHAWVLAGDDRGAYGDYPPAAM